MNEQRLLLLKKAIENDRILRMSMAKQLYGSSNSAKQAVQSMEFKEILERRAPGVFEVVRIPAELEHVMDEDEEESEYEKVPA